MHMVQDLGYGRVEFEGSPTDLRKDDMVLDNTHEVVSNPVPAKHFGKDGFVSFDLEKAGEPAGRAVLAVNTSLRFIRDVDDEPNDEFWEPQIFQGGDFVDGCPDENCDCDEEPDTCILTQYSRGWSGPLRDAPVEMLVEINLEPEGKPVRGAAKIIDTIYPNGAVVFTDGTAYQSNPDWIWLGWLKVDEAHDGLQSRVGPNPLPRRKA